MPLTDGAFERGKCGYKLLQYCAAGLPFVASPVGVNRDITCRAGMPAPETVDDWISALMTVLHASVEQRGAMGNWARSLVEDRYSYANWQEAWLRSLAFTSSDVGLAFRPH
jgi:glycosyltransferase involved in cell wall biosynthesis